MLNKINGETPDKTNKQTNQSGVHSLLVGAVILAKKKQRGQDFIIQRGHIYTKIEENQGYHFVSLTPYRVNIF